ncbi:MAG: PQQ-dependent dehydrogenase, methanol/ethanol family [Acidobacteria bacterium]|nr:PQQ-dependent dehydrogenase, methanol/ethanol family [Acidobacteriota bacterium]
MKRTILFLAWALPLAGQLTYERIRKAEAEPGHWLTYSGNYQGHRHSPLRQITTANIGRLKPVWVYQTQDLNAFETTPLVVDGIMYISEPPSNATALDIRTGRPLWAYRRNIPEDVRVCCGQVNRGLAMLDDLLFVGTVDAHLVALDAKTGRLHWDVELADYKTGHSITVAPLAVKDKVIVGISGGEYGVRGFLDAYDAKTGKLVWRFWTVPGPGEPGHETWAGDSWKTGSATTWVTGSYDPELNLLYWGTGNPGPDYNSEVREGDNLYSDSLLALDPDTGKLRWYFQFTPHDAHDWDSTHVPVLVDGAVHGAARKLVVMANRNGFYYVFDGQTGEFLSGQAYAKQTWAKGLDDRGKPILIPNMYPSIEGTVVYPGLHGGTNWFSPSYSPQTNLFYVAVREEGTTFYVGAAEHRPGAWFAGGGIRGIPGVEPSGSVKALEVETGKTRWEFPLHSPPWTGLLSTAGGLVFGGTNEGHFFALDAATGKPLWRFPTGGAVLAGPISYLSEGKQHVAIAAGHALFVFAVD